MRLRSCGPLASLGLAFTACADPCLDDGLVQQDEDNCDVVVSGTETESTGGESSSSSGVGESSGVDSSSDDGASSSSSDATTDGETTTWCVDQDGDGFGDPTQCVEVPEGEDPPPDTVDNDDDCSDNDPQAFPGAAELDSETACLSDVDEDGWGDDTPEPGVDPGNDCLDEDPTVFPGAAENESDSACMQDADGDGWGDATPPPGVDPGLDCLDDDDDAFPGAAPLDDATACMQDADGDDHGNTTPPPSVMPGSDCDDADAQVPATIACLQWCADDDLDGFGDPATCVVADMAPPGYVDDASDCADDNANAFPGAAENDLPAGACMEDVDGDGFGDAMPPLGVVAGGDCDDADPAVVTGCAPCNPGELFCNPDGDVAQCNANGTHAAVTDDCDFGCDEVAIACWPALTVDAHTSVCVDITLGDSVALDATVSGGDGSYGYAWSPEDSLDDDTSEDPVATPVEPTTYTLQVTDGEGSVASDSVTVNVTDVAWRLDAQCDIELLPTVFGPSDLPPQHVFSQGGTVACNLANALPSALVCPREYENVRITGRLSVDTNNDNDAIGFVWGWQDAGHFYILSWKEATQPVVLWGNVDWREGITIKRVHGDPDAIDSQDVLRELDTASSTLLADPDDTTNDGWAAFEDYDIEIEYASPSTHIVITRASDDVVVLDHTVVDGNYPSGRFGTFDASQDQACNGPWTSECL